MSSSSESDSDDDIERMFARAKQQTSARKRTQASLRQHDMDDKNDQDDDDSIEWIDHSSKRRSEIIDISEDDDDDDSDSDVEQTTDNNTSKGSILKCSSVLLPGGRPPRDASRNALASYRNLAEKQMHAPMPDSDDDDDEKTPTLEQLQQQAGANQAALECLRQAQLVRTALEMTQQQHQRDLLSPPSSSTAHKMSYDDVDDDSVVMLDGDPDEIPLGDLLTIQVCAEIRQGDNSSTKSIQATMYSNQQFSVLEKTIVQLLELPPTSNAVLKFQGKLLRSNRPALLSNIPAHGATIEATVFEGVSEAKLPKKVSPILEWGKPMKLTIRGSSTGKVDMKLGAKQPFQHLLKELAQKYGKNEGDIRLMFDGETLNPAQTPMNYGTLELLWFWIIALRVNRTNVFSLLFLFYSCCADMEDEDLIEAKGI